ncbi:malate synthase G [Glaciecola sp. 1036]|uniref:malate synthase G n=1 Tax=Alteromonadaceae TaxID=72275 RepID=UPI003D05552D
MSGYTERGQLKIANQLFDFIEQSVLPNSQVESGQFWQDFEALLVKNTPVNQALLDKRDQLQAQIDEFHQTNQQADFASYKQFLQDIGYLLPTPEAQPIATKNVDAEIATMAGPQLVVPINNARYALNAVNARWGSLYDAYYGTDVISEQDGAEKTASFNPVRGQKVVAKARELLDQIAPLQSGFHAHSTGYEIKDGKLVVKLADGGSTELSDNSQLTGYKGDKAAPTAILLVHNGLHAEIQFDAEDAIGKDDPAFIKDVLIESALTTIMDCEDSVAAVDAEDKTLVYQNWFGLMMGDLSVEMRKNGKAVLRKMHADREYISPESDQKVVLSGRSLMFVRNVGHLMQNDAILLNDQPVYEGLMDGVITSLIAKHDLLGNGSVTNSKTKSIYIVKPKMHGPDEVAFTNQVFADIEDMLGLERFTIKMGIMDEERRTSLNLAACIAQAKDRVVFINTGFLDRTGDEIHTSMLKGAFAPKAELKERPWITAYEKANVCTGLAAGLSGKAQIGKGMWPIPDQMAKMMEAKIGHPKSGANTAWVPSPTAATLHALHYHQVDVFGIQAELASQDFDGIDTILDIPLLSAQTDLTNELIQREIDNNVQGILGYVVRWVHQGIGCSKVPDINGVGLMEDRATLRISSQHIANWLEHNIVTPELVDESLQRMAKLVDEQNQTDSSYIPMTPDVDTSIGYQAARDLIFLGKVQPNGYTEPLLHERRREMKAALKN